jgi:polyisoprenoid-binding protein YceI
MIRPRRSTVLVLGLLLAGSIACGAAASPAATLVGATATRPAAVATPASGEATSQSSESTSQANASTDDIRLELAESGNEARYRVREQLANLSLPSDAVGKTSAVTGAIVLHPDGTLAGDQSKFVVDVTGLTSDQNRRDNFVRRNVLETGTYPTVEFLPNQVIGLPSPLPTSGEVTFQLAGDLTIHGVTRPTTWQVTATVHDGRELAGTASTAFTFADFELNQPRVPVVLSIEDTIKLEIDFHMVRAG